MKNQSTNQPGRDKNLSGFSAFIHQPPVHSDHPITKPEKQDIARQASVARGWLRALGVR